MAKALVIVALAYVIAAALEAGPEVAMAVHQYQAVGCVVVPIAERSAGPEVTCPQRRTPVQKSRT